MSTERILIHGTTAQRMATTPALGQIGSDDETGRVVVGDGVTPGGIEMARLDEIGGGTAEEISYDNAVSGLSAGTVQGAIDEIVELKANNSDLESLVSGAEVQSFTSAEKGQIIANIGGGVLAGFRDKLINGDGSISQASYTTVGDDAYWCDQHYVLTQTAAITPTVLSDVANGLPSMMRLTQSQATAQRMGNAQIVEAQVSKRLRGKKVTLGGKMRCSSAQVIRYAVLEWTGAADAVTSDVVLNWASGSYAAGGFFLASNLVVAAVGSITPAANTVTDCYLLADISSACNNLVVLYWTEGTAAQNVTLDMAWGLVEGDASAEKWPYSARHPEQEFALCQRYYEVGEYGLVTQAAGTNNMSIYRPFQTVKRSVPTVSGASLIGTFEAQNITRQGAFLGRTSGTNARNEAGTYIADARL